MQSKSSQDDTENTHQLCQPPRRWRTTFSFLCVKIREPVEPEPLPVGRYIECDGEKDLLQIYSKWSMLYRQQHPNFNNKTNKIELNDQGGLLTFSDQQAEENFLRHLATITCGMVLDKGIHIATMEDGLHIDPRTNQEFLENGYATLGQMLASGMSYMEIPSPNLTTPTPF